MDKLKTILSSVTMVALLAGCGASSQNMRSSSLGPVQVTNYYQNGYVERVNKVLISKTAQNVIGGALGGALIGGLIGKNAKGALIGGGAGALIGGVGGEVTGGNEDISYETTIISNGYRYLTHLDYELRIGTPVEFTLEDGKIDNINPKKRY